ncbi:MAG: MlaE family lipid ABC transporter permease subunit [Gammaproteobacteria bacterium]|nr:MlaE family lipid ABC transporter permease subunit [Gammaproteobacteria bacterium]NNF60560.1 MlaE family lipid ABC transporter permease subunit [Gammaproteobacteria bacterium]NNM20258.1 MlaE family lipid ABC transporter permease subunit [Gammaproteobacteria bacterium]
MRSGSNKSTQSAASVRVAGPHIECSGRWTALRLAAAERQLRSLRPPPGELQIDLAGVQRIDTAGAWLLHRTRERLQQRGNSVSFSGQGEETDELLQLAAEQGCEPGNVPRPRDPGFLENLGRDSLEVLHEQVSFLSFIGHITFSALRVLLTPARLRWRQVVQDAEEAGFDALPIVGLLSFLIGVVIAYQGGVVLQQYGAGIFIADLVGLAMLRELSPLVTAIIVAGRTGSAYTAQIGTMKVTEEVDAMRTMGIMPIGLLVLPKLFALILMLPLLTVFADIMGLLGGMVMAGSMLDVSFQNFVDRLTQSVRLQDYLVGVGKAPVFAAIIASVGCYQGFRVSGSAESVGRHTTISVVQSIFLVIVVDAIFSIVFSRLDI